MMKTVNVLWTGGLDSTCRIAELSKQEVIVQPYYVIDPSRGSIKYELKAIHSITKIIRKEPTTKCELNDVILVKMDSIREDKEITDAWLVFKNKYKLGSQYDWLARFARQNNLLLEVGLESSPRSKATNTLKGESRLIEDETALSELKIDVSHQ